MYNPVHINLIQKHKASGVFASSWKLLFSYIWLCLKCDTIDGLYSIAAFDISSMVMHLPEKLFIY